MGLDMYLEARVSAYKPWNKEDKPEPLREALEAAALAAGLPPSSNLDYITISREVGYWRKANQIHAYFVAECQDGKDDCGHYAVYREQLNDLRDKCQRIINECPLVDGEVTNGYSYEQDGAGQMVKKPIIEQGKVMTNVEVAQTLLPTAEGFFFGSTDYNEWYIGDLKETVAIIDRCLALPDSTEFYYHSSW